MSKQSAPDSHGYTQTNVMEIYIHEMRNELSSVNRNINQLSVNARNMDKEIHNIGREVTELRKLTLEGFRRQQDMTESLCELLDSVEKKLAKHIKSEDGFLYGKEGDAINTQQENYRRGRSLKTVLQEEEAEVGNMVPENNQITNEEKIST